MDLFREYIVKWIVCDDQPFVAIECHELQMLLRLLNPNIKCPSADTIHNEIMDRYKEEKNTIREILQVFFFLFFIYLLNCS